ncbi:MAG: hypothetical protein HZB67_00970 [Candidatus Aenigmarchaeota archaeon]|nr:hypothetical protein [Candidatus Aenigmarchaeota archaeon]
MPNDMFEEMTKLELKELIKKAHELYDSGIKWHNHFLTPKCVFNTRGGYAVILEDETNGVAYYSSMKRKPTDAMKEIEKLFYLSIKEKGA